MKKSVLWVLLVGLLLFIGCSENGISTTECEMTIEIDSSISRSVQAIPMETAKYHVVVSDSSSNVVFEETGSVSKTNYSITVNAGSYTVLVEALNEDDIVIGSGSQTKAITPSDSTVNVSIYENTGKGTFEVSVSAAEGVPLSLKIMNSELETVDTKDLSFEDGTYSVSTSIDNGFYFFAIVKKADSSILYIDTVRIIAGQNCSFQTDYSFLTSVSISISNNIVEDYSISLSIPDTSFHYSQTINATATTNVINGQFMWALDNEFQSDEWIQYQPLSLSLENLSRGEHRLSIFVKNERGVLLSDSVLFSVLGDYIVGSRGPAGGLIFYDCDADNDQGNTDGLISSECGWRYLEAAPQDISSESCIWGYYRTSDDGENIRVQTSVAIGTGKTNTELIVSLFGDDAYTSGSGSEKTTNYAAKLCLDYEINGFGDWFLPSKDELNLMYVNLHQNGLGDFNTGFDSQYWSSSDNGFSVDYVCFQWFNTGEQTVDLRGDSDWVRAIRSF